MEILLRKLPSPLKYNGNLYRLTIIKLKEKWLVSYNHYDTDEQLIWRHNTKLVNALNMMMAWAYEHNLVEEEKPNVDFSQLETIAK